MKRYIKSSTPAELKASRTIDRWNHNTEEYEPVEIPDDWNVKMYSDNMDEQINCVNCGKPMTYGEGYTSRRYHNKYGMGYMECEDCYEEQLRDEFGKKDVDACNNVMASTTGQSSDFTVIQEIYDDGYVYMTEDNVEPVYTQEYDVNLSEVLTKYPEAEKYGLKGWTDETFKPGDIITKTHFAKYVEFIVGDEQMYSDFKDYIAQHPEFDKPARNIEIRINNPSCLPSAEEERRKQSEELGKRLGKMLGLSRY